MYTNTDTNDYVQFVTASLCHVVILYIYIRKITILPKI